MTQDLLQTINRHWIYPSPQISTVNMVGIRTAQRIVVRLFIYLYIKRAKPFSIKINKFICAELILLLKKCSRIYLFLRTSIIIKN